MSSSLSDEAKEMIVKMSYVVLLADHTVKDEEIKPSLKRLKQSASGKNMPCG